METEVVICVKTRIVSSDLRRGARGAPGAARTGSGQCRSGSQYWKAAIMNNWIVSAKK